MATAPVIRILRLRPAGSASTASFVRFPADPDRFVTISTWSDWAAIEAATGGDIRRPTATRHSERLVAWEATHSESLEILG